MTCNMMKYTMVFAKVFFKKDQYFDLNQYKINTKWYNIFWRFINSLCSMFKEFYPFIKQTSLKEVKF